MLTFLLISSLLAMTPDGDGNDSRNVMLNAGSATEPREINIGLPGGSVLITVDRFKHAHGLPGGPHHWVNGNAYEPLRTIGLMESVLWYGQYGLSVDSRTRLGRDKFSGTFTGSTSVNGLIRFDGALTGPIGKGWSFSLGAYVNYDPTSVHSPSRFFVDQKQIYQASLIKRWSADESLSMLYRISLCNDSAGGTYSVAPFVYKGDGSISKLNGFRLGKDCYMPADESATWQNPRYKKYRNEFTFSDGSTAHIDYTGNTVTGISRLMLEIDPSYRWKGLRVWTSIRYYSRQFVSRTNLAWFNGHFETFAGADWDIVSHHRVSLNLVNLFLQRGAKGSIDIADTIDDVSALDGFIMAGSYIRPFTAELSYTYKF